MSRATVGDLVERGRQDRDFRARVLRDLEGTLNAEGYELSADELAAARELHNQAQGMTEDELDQALAADVVGHGGA